jgi:hypothetical protein
MSIALQAEREAIRRYSMLAEKMRDGDNTSAAGLFERMVIEEEEQRKILVLAPSAGKTLISRRPTMTKRVTLIKAHPIEHWHLQCITRK